MTPATNDKRRLLIGLVMLPLAGAALGAESFATITLTPSRAPLAHEAIWLKVTVGILQRGAMLRVSREDGQLIGTISPFGARARTPQDYTLPLPKDVTGSASVRLRIQIQDGNGALRPPSERELIDTALIYVPAD